VVSTDGGISWTESTSAGPRSQNSFSLIELPDDRIAAIGGSYIVVSDDLGETWERVGPSLPYEPFGLAYSAPRDTFYAWRLDCNFENDNPLPADSIIRLDPLG
jgi:hypothetical protein